MHDREREGRRRGCDALWQMNKFYWSIGQCQRWFYPVTFKTLPSISKCFAVKGILLGRVLLYTSVLTPLLPGHLFNNSKGWKRLLFLYWKWTQVCIIVCILCWSWPPFFLWEDITWIQSSFAFQKDTLIDLFFLVMSLEAISVCEQCSSVQMQASLKVQRHNS